MRILTMITGALFISGGIFLVANGGLTFMSLAFPIGILFIVAGIVECLSYNSYRGDDEEKSWILIDGTTTFLLGALIVLDKLTADAVVPMVLGLWVITTGVRNFVRAWENIEDRKRNFYDHLLIGLLNLVSGLYVFFDGDILNLTTLMIVGICIIVQGINIFHVGATIVVLKPEFLKSKEEKLEEAAARAEELRLAAKEAIKEAKAAHEEVKIIEEMPEGLVDITAAPKPGTPEAAELADVAAVFHGTAGPIVLAALEGESAKAEPEAAEEAPAEAPAKPEAEEAPKPKRTRKKAETGSSEEAPKRTRKKAETAPSEEEPKPKRTRKKAEPKEETEEAPKPKRTRKKAVKTEESAAEAPKTEETSSEN